MGQCPDEVSVKMWLRAQLPSLYLPQLDICNSLIASCSPTSFLAAFLITYSFSASSFHRTLPHLPAPGGLQGAVGKHLLLRCLLGLWSSGFLILFW